MLSTFRSLLVFVFVLMLAGCSSDGTKDVREGNAKLVTTTDKLAPPDTTSPTGAYVGISDYRLGPQDVLEVAVYQLEELNRSVRVNSKGMISLPLLGPIRAAGKTVPELEAEIAQLLEKDYLQNPQVTLYVREFTSQRITVEGAVRSPGIFPLSGRTSLLQAIVMSGGVNEFANPRGIIIFRVIEGKRMAAVFDLRLIRGGNAEDPQVYGDDLIIIDESGTKSAYRDFLKTMPLLGLFTFL